MPEFGNSILCEQGFKNTKTEDLITGFQLRVRISYYRGIFLSILDGYEIEVDGEKFENDKISFSLDNKHFIPCEELDEHTEERWEYGDKAYLHIQKAGGLSRGLHHVKVKQKIAVPYLPFPTEFYQEKDLTIV